MSFFHNSWTGGGFWKILILKSGGRSTLKPRAWPRQPHHTHTKKCSLSTTFMFFWSEWRAAGWKDGKRKGASSRSYTCRRKQSSTKTKRDSNNLYEDFNLEPRRREISVKLLSVWIRKKRVSSCCILGNIGHLLARCEGSFTSFVMHEKINMIFFFSWEWQQRNRFVISEGKTHFLPRSLRGRDINVFKSEDKRKNTSDPHGDDTA